MQHAVHLPQILPTFSDLEHREFMTQRNLFALIAQVGLLLCVAVQVKHHCGFTQGKAPLFS